MSPTQSVLWRGGRCWAPKTPTGRGRGGEGGGGAHRMPSALCAAFAGSVLALLLTLEQGLEQKVKAFETASQGRIFQQKKNKRYSCGPKKLFKHKPNQLFGRVNGLCIWGGGGFRGGTISWEIFIFKEGRNILHWRNLGASALFLLAPSAPMVCEAV